MTDYPPVSCSDFRVLVVPVPLVYPLRRWANLSTSNTVMLSSTSYWGLLARWGMSKAWTEYRGTCLMRGVKSNQNHIYFIIIDIDVGFRWVNTLMPNETIWYDRSGSTLPQVMACCLMAPSHYLNQCWLLFAEVLWSSPESNFTANVQATVLYNEFEN